MSLPRDLISQFVKITKDKEPKSKETIVYGVVSDVQTEYDENGIEYKQLYVKIDGASDPIPVLQTAVDAVFGNRVIVMIKNHSAIITGNMGSPATTLTTTEGISSKANSAYNLATQANTNATEAVNKVTELGVVVTQKVDTEEFTAELANINNLETDSLLTQTVKANSASITDKLDAEEASITYATIENLDATNTRIDKLEVGEGNFEQIEANTANIEKLETEVGDINTLLFGSATGESLHVDFANAVVALLGDAWIKSAMINDVSASTITSGDILTNKVRVMSEDGGLIISDKLIQIKEGETVRVQIGKDTSGNYSIIFCDESGNTMFSKDGITENAIKSAIVVNDMVSATANIHASKLDINSLFEEINGSTNTIKSAQITVDDEGQTLTAKLATLATTESVGDLSKTVSSQGTQITANTEAIETKVWQQDIETAKTEIGETTSELSTNYSELEQTVDGISTTVAKHSSQIDEKASTETVQSLIQQLTDSISMLVTDGNGTSLMTQTESGWVFSTEQIQNSINSVSESVTSLYSTVGDVDNTVSILQEAIDDIGAKTEYVHITTYEDEPCVELGEADSDFKLRITNTRMLFTEGSTVLAYFTNQSFHSKKVVVEEELRQGGFVWKVRSNGNLGLVWRGGSN